MDQTGPTRPQPRQWMPDKAGKKWKLVMAIAEQSGLYRHDYFDLCEACDLWEVCDLWEACDLWEVCDI